MSHGAMHSARVMRARAARSAAFGVSGAGWLLLVGLACSDGDATPAYSYPFDPNAELPPTAPVNTVTTVAPNQPGGENDIDEANLDGDLNATGGAGGNGGVGGTGAAGIGAMGGLGGVGGSPGISLGGDGGFYGFTPDDPGGADTAGFGGAGGIGGTGGAAGGVP